MTGPRTQAWLKAWQADFGEMLRTPLATNTGSLRAQPDHYPQSLVIRTLPGPLSTPEERLAVYNRQYWFRLLTVLQTELLLTSRLFGLWFFNQYALRFLEEHPPCHFELRRIAHGFEAFLADVIPSEGVQLDPARPPLPRAALLQAAQLDSAFARVFCAPVMPRLELKGIDPAELMQLRLTPSAAYARFTENWPMVKLRHGCADDRGETALPLPAAHESRHWVLFRNDHGVVNAPLTPAQARLYELLERLPLGAALAQLESEAPPALHEALPELTRRWLEQLVEYGYFCGTSR